MLPPIRLIRHDLSTDTKRTFQVLGLAYRPLQTCSCWKLVPQPSLPPFVWRDSRPSQPPSDTCRVCGTTPILRTSGRVGPKGFKRFSMKPNPNVNVTLPKPEWYAEKKFPCPVCGASLTLRVARTQKPYCHCDACGIQLFFRGKNGIHGLKRCCLRAFSLRESAAPPRYSDTWSN